MRRACGKINNVLWYDAMMRGDGDAGGMRCGLCVMTGRRGEWWVGWVWRGGVLCHKADFSGLYVWWGGGDGDGGGVMMMVVGRETRIR